MPMSTASATCVRVASGKPIDGEWQHIGALRIADQQHALLAEVLEVVADHPVDVGREASGVRGLQK